MNADWSALSNETQLAVAAEALRRAVETIAGQADILAEEMAAGHLADLGGPDALRLFATVVRVNGQDGSAVAGHG